MEACEALQTAMNLLGCGYRLDVAHEPLAGRFVLKAAELDDDGYVEAVRPGVLYATGSSPEEAAERAIAWLLQDWARMERLADGIGANHQ